jgi:DNA modification methylase
VIFDPFGGSGTVGLVCRQHHRHYVLCEINEENAELARRRITEGVTSNDKKRLVAANGKQEPLPMVLAEELMLLG